MVSSSWIKMAAQLTPFIPFRRVGTKEEGEVEGEKEIGREQIRKERRKKMLFLFKGTNQKLHMLLLLIPIGQNLDMWPHLTIRKTKYNLWLGGHLPR